MGPTSTVGVHQVLRNVEPFRVSQLNFPGDSVSTGLPGRRKDWAGPTWEPGRRGSL